MTFRKKLDKVLEYFLSFLMGAMVLNVVWQVASRFIFSDPSSFTDELARFLLIWIGLLGSAYASGKHLHLGVAILETKLSIANKKKLGVFINVLILLFAVTALVVGGCMLVYISFRLGQTSSALKLPLGVVYTVVPLSGLLITFYSISDLIHPPVKTHE